MLEDPLGEVHTLVQIGIASVGLRSKAHRYRVLTHRLEHPN